MTSTQVVETSVSNNNSFQNYPHQDDHTIQTSLTRCYNIKELTPLPVSVCGRLHKSPLQLGVHNLLSPINKVQFVNQHSPFLKAYLL